MNKARKAKYFGICSWNKRERDYGKLILRNDNDRVKCPFCGVIIKVREAKYCSRCDCLTCSDCGGYEREVVTQKGHPFICNFNVSREYFHWRCLVCLPEKELGELIKEGERK